MLFPFHTSFEVVSHYETLAGLIQYVDQAGLKSTEIYLSVCARIKVEYHHPWPQM